MSSAICRRCGVSFPTDRFLPPTDAYCCTGCATVARVPVDAEGNFPVNSHLLVALGVGLLFFNQLLFAGLGVFQSLHNRPTAPRFLWLAAGAAFTVWIAAVAAQRFEGAARRRDWLMDALVLFVLFFSLRQVPSKPVEMITANGVLIVWNVRGLFRNKPKNR